jgi:hypothetical protein
VNESDPSGLGWIYVLINKSTNLPYYVGQTQVSVQSRLLSHTESGRYNPDEDTYNQIDLGDVSPELLSQIEQVGMSATGTVQPGVTGYNQQNVFRYGSYDYFEALEEGNAYIKGQAAEGDAAIQDFISAQVGRVLDNNVISSRVIFSQRIDTYEFSLAYGFGEEGYELEGPDLVSTAVGGLSGCATITA